MGIKEIKNCAGQALELGDSINKLNLSLFGVDVIDDELDKFADVCKVEAGEKKILKIILAEGISDMKQGTYERARNSFKLANEQVFGSALIKIKEVL